MPGQAPQADGAPANPSTMATYDVKNTFHFMTKLYEGALQEFIQFCSILPGFTKLPIADQESIIRSKRPGLRFVEG